MYSSHIKPCSNSIYMNKHLELQQQVRAQRALECIRRWVGWVATGDRGRREGQHKGTTGHGRRERKLWKSLGSMGGRGGCRRLARTRGWCQRRSSAAAAVFLSNLKQLLHTGDGKRLDWDGKRENCKAFLFIYALAVFLWHFSTLV
jgi:hypothetical protein